MKQSCRILGVFLCVLILSSMTFPVYASAAGSVIDTSTANEGYFTVTYHDGNSSKMKVGLVGSSGTKYLTYEPGEPATFSFPEDGSYTITLFKNVVGTSYRTVTSTQVTVKIQDELAPYLVSTDEITFSDDDVVGQVASKLCKDLQDTDDKVLAIHNYIASNFSYNNDFADAVNRGEIRNYVPDTTEIITTQTGVCYDFSALFAAMCRSQGIPCAVQKGYYYGSYHAWNNVYVGDQWVSVDLTASIANGLFGRYMSQCLIATGSGTAYAY